VAAPVSVIIAARNEQERIAAAVDSAIAAGAAEVIVVDGQSSDQTAAIARTRGAIVITCEPMRSRQFNRGAAAASGEWLIFLHADTTLPPGAAAAVNADVDFGGFRIRFAEPHLRLRIAAFLINLRTRLTRCPWGDQAQFIKRSLFEGFREVPLMEDYDLALRMKKRGRTRILPLTVTTSGRRFLSRGVIRTVILNWFIVACWRLGVDERRLARWYGP
jgi:rSAM/selenodomain-associated transferase 2